MKTEFRAFLEAQDDGTKVDIGTWVGTIKLTDRDDGKAVFKGKVKRCGSGTFNIRFNPKDPYEITGVVRSDGYDCTDELMTAGEIYDIADGLADEVDK